MRVWCAFDTLGASLERSPLADAGGESVPASELGGLRAGGVWALGPGRRQRILSMVSWQCCTGVSACSCRLGADGWRLLLGLVAQLVRAHA